MAVDHQPLVEEKEENFKMDYSREKKGKEGVERKVKE